MPKTTPRAGAPEEVEAMPFEAALQRLEAVVDRLEQGDLELEQSLAAFEEGVRLSKRCASQLDQAEQRIEVLMKDGGQWLARPFASDDDEEDLDGDDD
jgi:exodeoxyribonuclease VII small subunit